MPISNLIAGTSTTTLKTTTSPSQTSMLPRTNSIPGTLPLRRLSRPLSSSVSNTPVRRRRRPGYFQRPPCIREFRTMFRPPLFHYGKATKKRNGAVILFLRCYHSYHFSTFEGNPYYLKKGELYLSSLLLNPEYFNSEATDGWEAILRASSSEHGNPETGSVTGDYYTLESMASFVAARKSDALVEYYGTKKKIHTRTCFTCTRSPYSGIPYFSVPFVLLFSPHSTKMTGTSTFGDAFSSPSTAIHVQKTYSRLWDQAVNRHRLPRMT